MAKKIVPKKIVPKKLSPGKKSTFSHPDERAVPTPEGADEDEEEPERLRSKIKENSAPEDAEDPDYLRQYQYKKVNNVPVLGSVAGALTDPDKGSKAERMKKILLTQKRISILVPLKPGTDPKVLASVTLNGYRLDLPTNTYIDVPEQVAEVLRTSNNQTVAALNQFKVTDKAKNEAGL